MIIHADVLDGLRQIETGSVRCCVTSPPYWGLRDYGHAGQIGLERTPDEYVARLVEVFRAVRRVLADDGTLWLNLGDSYANAGGPGWQGKTGQRADRRFTATRDTVGMRDIGRSPPSGLKPKDLCFIPHRVAMALQADGWWCRMDHVWSKPNPMPESVTDRCTRSHEYLFLLTKSERYYYDAQAIAEPVVGLTPHDVTGPAREVPGQPRHRGSRNSITTRERNRGGRTDGFVQGCPWDGTREKRNRRSVWAIPTQPFPEAHFAVMPEALVEPCILAGSAPGDLVLDPFTGSGTVGVVALRHGRRFVGCELNAEYVEMARRRIAGPLFAEAAESPAQPGEVA
jgi:DNA modification methylase